MLEIKALLNKKRELLISRIETLTPREFLTQMLEIELKELDSIKKYKVLLKIYTDLIDNTESDFLKLEYNLHVIRLKEAIEYKAPINNHANNEHYIKAAYSYIDYVIANKLNGNDTLEQIEQSIKLFYLKDHIYLMNRDKTTDGLTEFNINLSKFENILELLNTQKELLSKKANRNNMADLEAIDAEIKLKECEAEIASKQAFLEAYMLRKNQYTATIKK